MKTWDVVLTSLTKSIAEIISNKKKCSSQNKKLKKKLFWKMKKISSNFCDNRRISGKKTPRWLRVVLLRCKNLLLNLKNLCLRINLLMLKKLWLIWTYRKNLLAKFKKIKSLKILRLKMPPRIPPRTRIREFKNNCKKIMM